ncbi:MAG: M13 family metallopeptidase [Prevotella sp.]|jgi:putative endopeptidase|nr:M13 family metallopeptidase [Prevotella sp.]MCH4018197.1 M13 family metallopeptidase [Prevotella sp.]MCH4100515.1 M13 family metallopeptidase [Prevotella sp.]MCI1324680.1 M13 family metallopeptidase [Prevotella sp.]MCI1349381.1 M13 family metallopeptidase [Prevotella sp.]MCI1415675.1 M13 family metallopeptidase [Prevotella sp.]
MNYKILLFASLLYPSVTALAQNSQSTAYDRSNLDTSVKPGDNFYEFAAGGWLKSHPLDAQHTDNGAFIDLYELNQKRIRNLILEYASKPQEKGSLGQKIGDLYNLAMDSVRLNKEGWNPLKPTLERIKNIKDRREYQLVMAQLDRYGAGTLMFGIGAGADLRNASMNLVSIGQGGLGLGIREYYFKQDEQSKKIRAAYKDYLKKLFMMTGDDESVALKKVEGVWNIEMQIAKASYDQVKLRDVDANYHKLSYDQLVTDYPGIDWGNTFLAEGFPSFDAVCIGEPEPIHEVEKILANTPLDDLKAYSEIKVISNAANHLSDDFRKANFDFGKVMTGVKEDRPRWKRAVSLVSGTLGEAIGKLYVEKYFPASSKKMMLDLVHNLQKALSERINEATWMGSATKLKAQDKLNNYIIKIGYPDKWKDYSGLQVNDSLSLYDNLAAINRWASDDYIARHVNKPVDKSEWGMTPQTINAYYNSTTNEICFPAAILQPPFFDPKADAAANYGGIGGVIGHEMSHGFDDQGSQFDKYGNEKNWWTKADKTNFEKRTKILSDYFSKFEVLPGVKINGKQTLGENIGDNGGLNIAYRAFQNEMKKAPLKTVDGFTPDQRFFLSWARVWASNMTPQFIQLLITSDVHSPNMARVNGALPQIDGWYDAFHIKRGDKMYLPKSKRAHIW